MRRDQVERTQGLSVLFFTTACEPTLISTQKTKLKFIRISNVFWARAVCLPVPIEALQGGRPCCPILDEDTRLNKDRPLPQGHQPVVWKLGFWHRELAQLLGPAPLHCLCRPFSLGPMRDVPSLPPWPGSRALFV